MARKRYYRRRYKKARWSANIADIPPETNTLSAGPGYASNTATLVTNPVQTNLTTSTVYTVKNIEGTFTIETTSDDLLLEDFTVYLMYVPQGMNVSNDYNVQHPEYIMAYKFIGSPSPDSPQQFQPLRIKTRLARNLQTGDSIILFIKAYNQTTTTRNYSLQGVVRWWTKAN